MMKNIFIILLFLNSFLSGDELKVAILIYKNGIVKVKHKDSIKKESIDVNSSILSGDSIITYRSIATIKLNDNSIIKLAPHSKIIFEYNKITQNSGKIFYKIEKRKKGSKFIVLTQFSTIGVKGTTFIIEDSNKTKGVILKNGKLSLKSIQGLYKIYKKQTMKEYKNYNTNLYNDFQNYQNSLKKEFIEYKKEFTLKENYQVSFKGNRVIYVKIDEKVKKEFDDFEKEFELDKFITKKKEF